MNKDTFQGKFNKKNYFEGWYLKFVSPDGFSFALIPGLSIVKGKKEFFLQYIDKDGLSEYFKYDEKDVYFNREKFELKIGKNFFSYEKAIINIEKINLKGNINFLKLIKPKKTLYKPSIMGPFSYLPFMQCNHELLSISHNLDGNLEKDGITYNFCSGKGYIEKDWGSSFPEGYIWLQSNSFKDNTSSFMLSLATIPFLTFEFNGFLGFIYFQNKYHLMATYTGAKIKKVEVAGDKIKITISDRKYRVEVEGISYKKSPLASPQNGSMSGTIHESIDGLIYIKIFDKKDNLIYQDIGKNSGVEIVNYAKLLK